MTIKPLADKVVVKKLEAEETTKGGLILSSGAQQKPQQVETPRLPSIAQWGCMDGDLMRNVK